MQPSFRNFQNKVLTQQAVELLHEVFSPIRIQFSHALDVAQEESLGQESSQRCLINRGRMLVHHSTNFDHWLDQLLRRKNVTQSQGGIEDLTHCACVDNTAGVIQPLQTWEWG